MKVLFLDVDGVLNSEQDFRHMHAVNPWLRLWVVSPVKVMWLKWIIEHTAAEIVLSSTWRFAGWKDERAKGEGFLRMFLAQFGLSIFDRTPHIHTFKRYARGEEIADWLRAHSGDIEQYAIVDDDSDMLPDQSSRFVQTSWFDGLTEHAGEELISILNHGHKPRESAVGPSDQKTDQQATT